MISSKSPKCKCGKTQDSNGNCDGSHANKRNSIVTSLISFALLTSMVFLQSFTFKADEVKIKSSKLNWVGSKVTGSHEGVVDLKGGSLMFEGDELTGGQFVIDMTSIECTDLSGEYKGKLEGHLKSNDFFGVNKYPLAKLNITDVSKTQRGEYQVSAKLTIKGQTQPIEFTTSIKEETAYAKLVIDRTLYGVIYGSGNFFDGLADNMIYDEFVINVELNFEK
jgi:polyisoprenoid-binding protein YceI